MKRIVSPVAFATILIPMILSANSTTVTFDTALTNGTEWAYSKVKSTSGSSSHVYFDTLGACVVSPEYPFNITAIEITLSCSSKEAARYLQVKPSAGDSQQTKSVAAKDKKENQTFLFAEEDGVRSFKIQLEGSGQTGNWHIYLGCADCRTAYRSPCERHQGNAMPTLVDKSRRHVLQPRRRVVHRKAQGKRRYN